MEQGSTGTLFIPFNRLCSSKRGKDNRPIFIDLSIRLAGGILPIVPASQFTIPEKFKVFIRHTNILLAFQDRPNYRAVSILIYNTR